MKIRVVCTSIRTASSLAFLIELAQNLQSKNKFFSILRVQVRVQGFLFFKFGKKDRVKRVRVRVRSPDISIWHIQLAVKILDLE